MGGLIDYRDIWAKVKDEPAEVFDRRTWLILKLGEWALKEERDQNEG